MAIKISFDSTGNPELPTMILAKRSGYKLGEIKGEQVTLNGRLNDASEMQFEIHKYQEDGETLTNLWYSIVDFRLLWCKEWDLWFEIAVELDEETETIKTIYCSQLGQSELSQIMLYDIQINTEDDIARDDYDIPTVLYNPEHPEASLLNRLMEHAPHYYIHHVDSTIMNIQRTFTFDDESIQDAFNEIAEEIECLFIYPSNSNEDGSINRAIDVYDLDSNCNSCGYRGDFNGICPECGSSNINEGYGEDTTIFISATELADNIQFGTDTESVKNCFKLEGGDDLMTATIRNCNPNGSDRIWYITDSAKEDMSEELQERLAEYDSLYAYYQNEYIVENVPGEMIEAYNELVTKYRQYKDDIAYLPSELVGYPTLMEAYYNTIDFAGYLQSELMPDATIGDTDAEKEAAKLIVKNLNPVAVEDVSNLSTASANNAVLAMAKVLVDERYQVKVNDGNLGSGQQWTGNFKVTNYSDEEDTALSETIILTITDDYEEYLRQMIEKELNKEDVNDLSITALFQMDYDEFCEELKKYCLDSLSSFWDAGQACLDILIEQGIADKETWGRNVAGDSSNLYELLYLPYYEKQGAIEAEMKLREDEIAVIVGTYDEDGLIETYGVQSYLYDERCDIQDALDFEGYLGEELWLEFSAFRREDKYSNNNYISDGLSNAELFSNALEFIETATKEIYKSAELQHSISSSLKNLLVIDKFMPLIEHFELGNWLRIRVDVDVYKLRLIEYGIDFDDFSKLSVDFSDVMKTLDGLSDKQSLISQASSMASSYDTVKHQASEGSKVSSTVDGWSLQGLDVDNVKLIQNAENETQSWDSHGMLFRKYDPVTETYSDEQLKIIHSTMVITDDNWETVRTAVGGIYYYDPADNYQLKYAYGINGEVLVGKLILGESLGIYNESGSLTFNENGLTITNDTNTFTLNPNSNELMVLSKGNSKLFYVDSSGNATFSGSLNAATGTFTGELKAASGTFFGEVTTEDDPYKTVMAGGKIAYYYNGSLCFEMYSSSESTLTVDTISRFIIGTDQELAYRYFQVRNGTTRIELRAQYDTKSTGGLWDGQNDRWIIVKEEDADTLGSNYIYIGVNSDDEAFGDVIVLRGDSAEVHSPLIVYGSIVATNGLVSQSALTTSAQYMEIANSYGELRLVCNSNKRLGLYDNENGLWIIRRNSDLDVDVGNTSHNTILYGSSVYVNTGSGSTAVTSDARIKSEISSLPIEQEGLFDRLSPKTFRFNSNPDKIHFGFIAQEVEQAIIDSNLALEEYGLTDSFIDEDGNELLAIRYEEIIPLLVQEVQDLKKKVRDLENG